MTILEDLKRSATDVADKAAKKTNELTAIAKLNLSIHNAKAKLESVYEEIGRLFYTAERTGDDYTGQIADAIMRADKIKAELDSYQAQIVKLRNISVCPNCGKEISTEALFCSFCGTKQEKAESELGDTLCETDDNCCKEESCECSTECDSCEEQTECCCEENKDEE